MPYRRLPKQLIHALVQHSMIILNNFPYYEGVSKRLSPNTIVTGRPAPSFADFKLEFGSYVLLTDRTTNTPRARAFGAIALYPTGSRDGSYRFLSLVTGEVITKAPGHWTEVPITDPAIARVENMARAQGQPPIQDSNLLTEWSPDQVVDEDENDGDYEPGDEDPEDEELEYDSDPDQDDFPTDGTPGSPFNGSSTDGDASSPTPNAGDSNTVTEDLGDDVAQHTNESTIQHPTPQGTTTEDQGAHDPEHDDPLHNNSDEEESHDEAVPEDPEASGDESDNEEEDSPVHHGYSLRGNRERNYDYRFANVIDAPANTQSYDEPGATAGVQLLQVNDQPSVQKVIHGWVMTQMSAKAGIRRFGDAARDAMRAEFRQLDEKGVFDPVPPNSLDLNATKQALRCINVIKQKRCGKIKGRTCADGRPQRNLYEKSETSSPTASSDAIMLTLIVDALERRDVATADVAGAYLNADMEDYVLMKLEGEDARLMCDVNPSYKEYVTHQRGQPVLYLRLAKALYGCVKSAMLWYKLFTSTLRKLGFKLNPYDSCVANAMIKGKQCTVVWYVDDNKVSHKDPEVVTKVIQSIERYFGKMTVTRGEKHEFLGMTIVFDKKDGTARICMSSYLRDAINESGMDIRRSVATPATNNLFTVPQESRLLERKDAEMFRSIVCKLLYVGLRARADILTALSYLTTRITKPTGSDYVKLKRLLEYLYGTLDLSLVLGADNLGTIYTWVDASYAVHNDMRSHTGGVISFGVGGLLCKSSKQKLNTKSSTEAELVGASDYLPNTIWVMNFMKEQGYPILHSEFAQDNESAIKLERNGRSSAGQRSRHIDIRHFWITDRLHLDDIRVVHCPTELMLADFLTKPLQGNLFRRFRNVLLGHEHIRSLSRLPPSTGPEERVGKSVPDEGQKVVNEGQKVVSWAEVVENGSVTQDSESRKVQGKEGTSKLNLMLIRVK